MSFLKTNSTFAEPICTTNDELKSFDDTFPIILNDINSILKEKPQSDLKSWLTSVVKYNVPHGKKIRGKLVETAFTILSDETEGKKADEAKMLGWCVEILQASFLVADDLMDNGITRRGQPCWYKVDNMGSMVANDALLLENLVYQIIKKHFGKSKIYLDLLDLMLDVSFKTMLGQSLDTRYSSFWDKKESYDQSPLELYNSIATLKTSYYTIYLPITLAMLLAGFGSKTDSSRKDLWKEFEDIALKIGKYFQIQDDYFDCFVDKEKTGKVGTDIEEGKCSWLYAMAVKLCDPKQKKILLDNYGIAEDENVSRVKKLYLELDMTKEFLKVKQEMATDILESIDKLDHAPLQTVLDKTFKQIYNRNC